jgi:putative FmdB family regulatory protein
MPNYDYQCEKCRKSFESFQSMSEAPLKSCPKALCQQKVWGKGKLRRLIGKGAGLLFKGAGFHATDNRSAGYKAAYKKEWVAKPGPSPRREATRLTKSRPVWIDQGARSAIQLRNRRAGS